MRLAEPIICPALLIMAPLLAAPLALLRRRPLGLLLVTFAAAAMALTGLTWRVWESGPQRYAVGGWGAPLGVDWYADGLSVTLLWLVLATGGLVSLYAGVYWRHEFDQSSRFWPAFLLLWTALNALLLTADLFNGYVTLELMTLAAVALVALAPGEAPLRAALRYLLFALLGSACYLLGVALLYGGYGLLDMAQLGQALRPEPGAWLAIALITVGLLLKTAIFPLHGWLPAAHANAPAPVSALLSGLVVKGSFYLLLRLWLQVFAPVATPAVGQLLGALGAGAILYGSWQALRQERLKLLVAYSTVAQMGYLLLVFPLAVEAAWNGVLLHALGHACAKAALFLAAGNLLYLLGSDRIAALSDQGSAVGVNMLTFGLAGVSIMGLPPSGAFLAKWLLLQAALDSGQWWWAPVILAGGLLAALYIFKALGYAFVPAAPDSPPPARSLAPLLQVIPLLLALLSLALGFTGTPILALLRIGSPFAVGPS